MDLMSLRRGIMMGMAGRGGTIYHGTFTPESDLTEYTVDVGNNVHVFIAQAVDGALMSGSRNFGYAIMFEDADGNTYEYGIASNTNGTSWAAPYWREMTPAALIPIEKNGTQYTVYTNRLAAGCSFKAGIEYEWFAY